MGTFRRLLPMLGGQDGARLILPGYLDPRFSFSRAQAGGARSVAAAPDGTTRVEFDADVPRFNGVARRLLIEGQRTNGVRNPRAEGAAAGVWPALWSTNPVIVGVSALPLAAPTRVNGVDCIDVAYSGTSSSAYNVVQSFDFATGALAAPTGTAVSARAFIALVAGTFPAGSTVDLAIRENDGANAFVRQTLVNLLGATSALTHYANSIVTGLNTATVAFGLRVTMPVATVTNFTIRLGWPQMETGTFASTTILPPVGTPGASTRGADLVSASLASLGIGGNGACTVLGVFMLPQAATPAGAQWLVQLDDGGNINRFHVRNNTNTSTILPGRNSGGVGADAASVGNMVAGVPFALGISIDGVGRMATSMSGGTAQAVTGGPTSGLTALRIGGGVGGPYMFGEVGNLTVLPYALPDAALAARVAAMPL